MTNRIEALFESLFERWAKVLARRRLTVLAVSLLIGVGLSCGMAMTEAYDELDNLWSPKGNISEQNKARSQALFKSTTRSVLVIATAKNGGNIITLDSFKEMGSLENQIMTYQKGSIKFQDVCIQSCRPVMPPLLVFSDSATLDGVSDQNSLSSALLLGKNPSTQQIVPMSKIFKETVPESVQQDLVGGAVSSLQSAKSALIYFQMADSLSQKDSQSLELGLHELAIQAREKEGAMLDFSLHSFSGHVKSINDPIDKDLGLMGFSVMLVATYCLVLLGGFSPRNSRILLSLVGLLNIGLAYTSAVGFLSLLGVKTSKINGILPFLLIGIGADDIFVIVQSIDQVSLQYPLPVRLVKGLKHSGPSITITSFTNVMAFFIGATSSLLALKSFCIFTAVGVMFLYLYTITFFTAVFVLDLERQQNGKGDFAGLCLCQEQSLLCCKGQLLTPQQIKISQGEYYKENKQDKQMVDNEQPEQRQSEDIQQQDNKQIEGDQKVDYQDNKQIEGDQKVDYQQNYESVPAADQDKNVVYSTFVEKFLHKHFSRVLMKTPVRVVVILLWSGYIALSCYATTIIVTDFQADYFMSKTSEAYRFLEKNKRYYQQGLEIQLFIENADNAFASPSYQQSVQQFFQDVDNCKGCSQNWMKTGVNSWYSLFLAKSAALSSSASGDFSPCLSSYDSTNQVVFENKFYPCLNALLSHDTLLRNYKNQLIFQNNLLVASQQNFFIKTISSSSVEGTAYLKDIRRLEQEAPNRCYTFNQYYYNFEQYLTFSQETISSVSYSVAVIFLVLMATTGSLVISLFVLLSVVLVILFLVSLLPLWDLTLNSITIVNVILALGLSVDYSAHIAHSYQICKVPSSPALPDAQARQYKVRGAFKQVGSSVFHGAFSTFLAIIVLSQANSYGFVVFFKMWFGIILFGVGNGMVFMPVLLSFIGPLQKEKEKEKEKKKEKEQDIDKTCQLPETEQLQVRGASKEKNEMTEVDLENENILSN